MKYLAVNILLVSVQAWSLASSASGTSSGWPLMVSAGELHTCELNTKGVKCWGARRDRQCEVPVLNWPTQVSAGRAHTCALDAEGVKCWGSNALGETNVPKLKSPTQVNAGGSHTCALDAEGVKCWGSNPSGETDVPVLKFPTQVSVGGGHTCALDAEGVKCWGVNGKGQTDVPILNSPTQVTTGEVHTCALDAKGVKCWGDHWSGATNVPALKSPTQVSAGASHTCAIDAEGVKCWGRNTFGETDVPVLNSPTQVSAGGSHTCALDAEGVKCWGANNRRQTNVPDLVFDIVDGAIPFVNSTRAEYLKPIVKLGTDVNSKAYYLECLFAAPAILSMDSSFFVGKYIPRFKKTIKWLKESFGFPGDIRKIPDTEIHRRFAVVSIQSALAAGLNFLNPESQSAFQDGIRTAGGALSDSMDNQKVLALIKQVDALSVEKQILKSSPRSAFLVDSLELAADWLREKVK